MAQNPSKEREDPAEETGFRWLQLPAIFVDTFSVDHFSGGTIIRLVFGEYVSREYVPFYRASVAMPLSDAKALARTLTRIVKDAEQELKTRAETETEEGEAG